MNDITIVTAADKNYANQALNLVGSIMSNSNTYSQIVLYDLGMTNVQIKKFKGIDRLSILKVPKFTKHFHQCWSWKIWVLNNCPGDKIIYLDAGKEVQRGLDSIAVIFEKNGYFLVSQYETLKKGHTLKDIIPSTYYKIFKIDNSYDDLPVVAAGIIGYDKKNKLFSKVLKNSLRDVENGLNLGWSKNELKRNVGINKLVKPKVFDCSYFRHDQTLLNIELYKLIKNPVIQPIAVYGEYKGPKIRKDQVIWNSRTNSTLQYVNKINYKRYAIVRNLINGLSVHNKFFIKLTNKFRAIKIKIGN